MKWIWIPKNFPSSCFILISSITFSISAQNSSTTSFIINCISFNILTHLLHSILTKLLIHPSTNPPMNPSHYQPPVPASLIGPEVVYSPSEEIEENRLKWDLQLIGFFWDYRKFSTYDIQVEINNNWHLDGLVTVTRIQKRFFALEFESIRDRNDILNEGPWNIQGALFVVRSWGPNFSLRSHNFNKAYLWVQMVGLPLDYVTTSNANKLAALIGARGATDITNPDYIRVKVEVSLDEPLIAGAYFRLDNDTREWIQFSYEKLFKCCYRCGRIDHTDQGCPLTLREATSLIHRRLRALENSHHLLLFHSRNHLLYTREIKAIENTNLNRNSRICVVTQVGPHRTAEYTTEQGITTTYFYRPPLHYYYGGNLSSDESMEDDEGNSSNLGPDPDNNQHPPPNNHPNSGAESEPESDPSEHYTDVEEQSEEEEGVNGGNHTDSVDSNQSDPSELLTQELEMLSPPPSPSRRRSPTSVLSLESRSSSSIQLLVNENDTPAPININNRSPRANPTRRANPEPLPTSEPPTAMVTGQHRYLVHPPGVGAAQAYRSTNPPHPSHPQPFNPNQLG